MGHTSPFLTQSSALISNRAGNSISPLIFVTFHDHIVSPTLIPLKLDVYVMEAFKLPLGIEWASIPV